MGTETIWDPVTAAGWAMAGRLKKTSSSVVVWGEETGVEDSDEEGSESGSGDVWLVDLKVGLRALKWGIQSRCRKGHGTFTGRI